MLTITEMIQLLIIIVFYAVFQVCPANQATLHAEADSALLTKTPAHTDHSYYAVVTILLFVSF
jgi:hypothetical protein